MLQERASGILLHPTSLPGPYGIGDLGVAARTFCDFLVEAGQSRWQVLPLGPTGFGDSPYAAFSSFAGNPLLISLEQLRDDLDLDPRFAAPPPDPPSDRVDYGAVIDWKRPRIAEAAVCFLERSDEAKREEFAAFCAREKLWLDDYALFMALKAEFAARARRDGQAEGRWNQTWDADIARRDQDALERWSDALRHQVALQKVEQFFFFRQWEALKYYANHRGIQLIGDLPIFVAMDSADVWASPESFLLDGQQNPTHVAGVPPDYFSETGQLWGNPLYRWDHMAATGFEWWVRRFRGTQRLFDIIRVDHFRGFEAAWTVPADQPTAEHGAWIPSPGAALFQRLRDELGELPILAEDLGVITPEVEHLRDANHFPGMRVLQFAFDSGAGRSCFFLPHRHIENCVVYTGTHDNDPIRGWFDARSEEDRVTIWQYLGYTTEDIAAAFCRLAMSSVARLVILPMQDVLGLGSESRMNTPGTAQANWTWRLSADYREYDAARRLAEWVDVFERRPTHKGAPPSEVLHAGDPAAEAHGSEPGGETSEGPDPEG